MGSDLDEEEIQEIFQVRVVLERLAYSLACENFNPSDGDTLRNIAHRIKISYSKDLYLNQLRARKASLSNPSR